MPSYEEVARSFARSAAPSTVKSNEPGKGVVDIVQSMDDTKRQAAAAAEREATAAAAETQKAAEEQARANAQTNTQSNTASINGMSRLTPTEAANKALAHMQDAQKAQADTKNRFNQQQEWINTIKALKEQGVLSNTKAKEYTYKINKMNGGGADA